MGKAAFFAPDTVISPESFAPPVMTNLSIACPSTELPAAEPFSAPRLS
jgi:hypothetical protein